MSKDLLEFIIVYPLFFFIFSVIAIALFSFLYSPLVVIYFVKSKKWFCILTTAVLILNALCLATSNYYLAILDFDDSVPFKLVSAYCMGLTFLSMWGYSTKISRGFEIEWLIVIMIIVNIILSYYPCYLFFETAMGV